MQGNEKIDKVQIREFIKDNQLKTADDVQTALKGLFANTIQEMLEAELENRLGYPKNGKATESGNRRKGHYKKTGRSDYSEVDLEVPRDRDSEYAPLVVKKHQKNITGIEDQIMTLYAKGVSIRDIQDHLKQFYGIEVSPTLISNITGKIMPMVNEWQNRPLQQIYTFAFLDAIHF